MAFDVANMECRTPSANMREWSYKSAADLLATIIADNYFNPIAKNLSVGDRISAEGSDDGSQLRVESITAGAVVVESSIYGI